MADSQQAAPNVHLKRWKSSRLNSLIETAMTPALYLLNRPSLARFNQLIHEFALRCNGIGNNVEGASSLTRAEERFLDSTKSFFANGLVLDVGANAGDYARHIRSLAPAARIIAFEPHPRTFGQLQQAAAAASFEALNMAMSDTPGTAQLYDFPDHDGSTQASLDSRVIMLHGGQVPVAHDVACTTLDAFAAEAGLAVIDLLKIDTEGFDLNVLRGALQLLEQKRIRMIHFEFIGSNIVRRVNMHDFFGVFDGCGYDMFRICLNGELLPLGPYSPKFHEIFVRHNLVALPRP